MSGFPVIYEGYRTEFGPHVIRVESDGHEVLDPGPSQKLYNHSPDGFEWGYHGSGPAQLALALLLDAGVVEPMRYYQDFKADVVSQWGDSWQITTQQILGWACVRDKKADET